MDNIVKPQPTGNKAVVVLAIEVYVEVTETDDYYDMVNQAKDQLNVRVVEGATFFPLSARPMRIYGDMRVANLKDRLYVSPNNYW